jgi:flagellar biogenesis protein FliO
VTQVEGATVWSLVQVFALLVGMVWLIPALARRAARRGGQAAGHRLRVLESVSCGGNRVLCLVRSGGKDLLLGVTDGGIALLQVVESPEAVPAAPVPSFRDQLHRILPRRGRDRE